MRKISFAFLLTLFFSMIGNRAFASVVIDGIYYYFNGDEAIVTNDISVNYIGDIVIPETVTYNGEYNQEIKGETNVEIIPVIA